MKRVMDLRMKAKERKVAKQKASGLSMPFARSAEIANGEDPSYTRMLAVAPQTFEESQKNEDEKPRLERVESRVALRYRSSGCLFI